MHVVSERRTKLGRDPGLPWCIGDRGVSSEHARISKREATFWLEDLRSTNGTFVNGHRLTAPRKLANGDHIQLGEHTLLRASLHDANEQQATERLYRVAVLDPLTGVYNRGHLEAVLAAEYATPHGSVRELLAAADRAVYQAKASGRDCVCEALDTCPASWRG